MEGTPSASKRRIISWLLAELIRHPRLQKKIIPVSPHGSNEYVRHIRILTSNGDEIGVDNKDPAVAGDILQ